MTIYRLYRQIVDADSAADAEAAGDFSEANIIEDDVAEEPVMSYLDTGVSELYYGVYWVTAVDGEESDPAGPAAAQGTAPIEYPEFTTSTDWYRIAASDAPQEEKDEADEVLTGSADYTPINIAIGTHDKVLLSTGTFELEDEAINPRAGTRLAGQGMRNGSLGTLLRGTYTTIVASGSQSQHNDPYQDITLDDTVITTKSDLTGSLSAGQRIVIRSGDDFSTLRAPYQKAEWAEISAIDSTSITLVDPIRDSYTASSDSRIYGYDLVTDIQVQDLTIELTAETSGITMARFEWCEDVTLTRVACLGNDWARRGLIFDRVYNGLMDQCEAYRVAHKDVSSGTQGYGLYLYGSEEVELRDCYGEGNRHSFDADGGNFRAISRNIRFVRCEAYDDWSAGVSTHGGTDYVTATDCVARMCGGGFVFRGSNTTIIRPKMRGTDNFDTAPSGKNESYTHGILIGEGVSDGTASTDGEGNAGVNLEITDADIDFTGSGTWWSGGPVDSVKIVDITTDATVSGTFTGHPRHGLRLIGKHVDGLTVSGSFTTGSGDKISIEPEDDDPLNVDTSGVS